MFKNFNFCLPVYILPVKTVFSSPLYSSANVAKLLLDTDISSSLAMYPWQCFYVHNKKNVTSISEIHLSDRVYFVRALHLCCTCPL